MARSKKKSPEIAEYFAQLPDDRREAFEAIRDVVNANLDPKIKEALSYGMPGWVVPHSVYPNGYHCSPELPLPFASLASQKNHMALYLFCIYCDPALTEWVAKEWKATGKRLDMGKSCIRFKSLDQVPLEVIAEAIRRMDAKTFIAAYEEGLAGSPKRGAKKKPAARKKAASKKSASKKPAAKKTASKKATARKKAPRKKAASKKAASKKAASKKAAKKAPARRTRG